MSASRVPFFIQDNTTPDQDDDKAMHDVPTGEPATSPRTA